MRPLCIAHRGAPRLAPENTLESFAKALEMPHVDAVELDVHPTADERIAVIHDDTLDRTTKAKGFVSQRKAEELVALGVPMLDDVLALVRERGKRAFVELKMQPRYYKRLPALVLALVRNMKVEEHVVFISFDHRSLVELKRAAPAVQMGALCGQRLFEPARYVKDYLGVDWWLPGAIGEVDSLGFFSEERTLDAESIRAARAAGVKTAVWTVNHPEMMRALAALDVDGVITDEPALFGAMR